MGQSILLLLWVLGIYIRQQIELLGFLRGFECSVLPNANVYYRWSKDFLEAGKKRLSGDTVREATTDEVKNLRAEKAALKETLAELFMENPVLKKSVLGDGEDGI